MESERSAEFVKERFEGVIEEKEPNTIEDYFNEWEKSITELSEKEIELSLLKEEYNQKEFEIVFLNADNVDFKEVYGSTSEKVRKHYASIKLQSLGDAKNDLEISIDYLKRRIDFIRSLMRMQVILLEAGVIELNLV